jgi:hypothetical protein
MERIRKMKIKPTILSMAMIVGLQLGLSAAPAIPRIDIRGLGKGKHLLEFSKMYIFGTTKAKVSYANWKWVKGKSYYIAYFFAAPTGKWTLVGTQFTPSVSGTVQITLLAQPRRKGQSEQVVYYDQLKVIGAKLENLSFEKHHSLVPAGWKRIDLKNKHTISAGVVSKPVKEGKYAVRATHDSRLVHDLKVEAGKKVIIEVWVYLKP